MWRMLQQDEPEDYVIATGETHTVREFCELAFARAGMSIDWRGRGFEEHAVDRATGRTVIEIDRRYLRPTEVDLLLGSSEKARRQLGGQPTTSSSHPVDLTPASHPPLS